MDEERADLPVAQTMIGGLLLSVVVMLVGLILTAMQGRSATHVLPLDQIPSHLSTGDGTALLDLGILLLFATPLAQVVVAATEFSREREFAFSAIAGVLLVILVIGFAVALK